MAIISNFPSEIETIVENGGTEVNTMNFTLEDLTQMEFPFDDSVDNFFFVYSLDTGTMLIEGGGLTRVFCNVGTLSAYEVISIDSPTYDPATKMFTIVLPYGKTFPVGGPCKVVSFVNINY